MPDIVMNPHRDPAVRYPNPTLSPRSFHRGLPGYRRTPLHSLDSLARELGLAGLLVKDETERLTLPAFKVLGASWAVFRWACEQMGRTPWDWGDVNELRRYLSPVGRRHLVTATDGNHGRGVAKTAAWLGWPATVFMPAGTVPARIRAIEEEGATVHIVDGSYDVSVDAARRMVDEQSWALLVQDTSWEGYEQIPAWIIEGYSTPLWEIEEERHERGLLDPNLVLAPVGVGSLAAAMARHYRREELNRVPALIGVEPGAAACLLESLRKGESVTVPPRGETLMAGLNCGTLASLAWPVLRESVDATLALEDEWAVRAMDVLREVGIHAGESGASSLAGLLALLSAPSLSLAREVLGIGTETVALVVVTEGITDPDSPALP